MEPVSPQVSSLGPALATGAALVLTGAALKIAQMVSSFVLKTFLETGVVYLAGKLIADLLDQTQLSRESKLCIVNIAMLATGYFAAFPVASVAASVAIFNFQSVMKDPFFGLGEVVNKIRSIIA